MDKQLPKVVSEHIVDLGFMELCCYILDDGRVIVTTDDVGKLIEGVKKLSSEDVKSLRDKLEGVVGKLLREKPWLNN